MQALRHTRGPLAAAAGVLAGAGVFFALPFDPFWAWGLAAAGVGLVFWPWVRVAGIVGVFAGLAFVLAAWQVARVEVPDYAEATRHAHWVVGKVADLKPNPVNNKRVTVVLERPEFYQLQGMEGVRWANIGVNKAQLDGVGAGGFVAMQAVLLAPEGEERRGGYDGRLWRFFNGERVFGYVQGAVEATYVPPKAEGWREQWQAWIAGARQKVLAASKGYADGVVAALLVNSEGQVPREVRNAYRDSGLSHLLAVSGTQITLVAGGVFVLLRWLMVAAWPGLALRINTKVWAGLGSLAAAGFYTVLAGGGVTVVRAFVMAVIVIGAVVAGRVGNLLRIWCLAVVLMVLAEPAVVARAGFQLSIAAVLGLILLSLVEEKPRRWWGWGREAVLASVMAGAFTALILVMNFGRLPLLAVPANVVATVPMTLATYLSFIGLLLLPVGGQGVPWEGAGLLADGVNRWAEWVAGLGFATVPVGPEGWGVIGVASVCFAYGVLAKRVGGALVGGGLVMVLAVMPQPLPEVVVWKGGAIGWERVAGGYALVWADNAERALAGCDVALGARCGAQGEVPQEPVERLMPVTPLETFAWAERLGGTWRVEPVACGRAWQRASC